MLSFFGALAYAELGAMFPATGGQYVYLREIYGPLWAFLCGWAYFFVILSASVAWLGIVFANYLAYFIPLTPVMAKFAAVALIVAVTMVNYRGVTAGATVQKLFTAIKLAGLLDVDCERVHQRRQSRAIARIGHDSRWLTSVWR